MILEKIVLYVAEKHFELYIRIYIGQNRVYFLVHLR